MGYNEQAVPVFSHLQNMRQMDQRTVRDFGCTYFDALLAGMQRAQENLSELAGAAETVARLLVEGGDLYIASVRPDFVSEGMTRSGGFMLLKEVGTSAKLSSRDAVIFSWTNNVEAEDIELLNQLLATGAFVFGIGPVPQGEKVKDVLFRISHLLDSSCPLPAAVTEPFKEETYPAISLQNLVFLWIFSAEVVSALTRLGYMPTMYQSVLVAGAPQRNARFKGLHYHEKGTVLPVPALQLGKSYLDKLASCFRSLRDKDSSVIGEVARVGARTLRDGHDIYAFLIGHFPVYQHGAPGDPAFMHRIDGSKPEMPSASQLEEKLKPGDLFVMFGYYHRPREAYEVAQRRGARTVEVIAGTDEPEFGEPMPDYVIRPWWPYGDSLVAIPGYDVKILPSSGIVQAAIYWAVVGSIVLELDMN